MALAEFFASAVALSADHLMHVERLAARAVGARSARVLLVDYGQDVLRRLGEFDPTAAGESIDGTVAGRVFTSGQTIVTARNGSTTVTAALLDDSERLGVVEFEFDHWSADRTGTVVDAVRALALVLVSKRRYTDLLMRTRRARELTISAAMQWDLLPPLACTSSAATIAGFLEPAYETGGDSFDYACNDDCLDFILLDAVGHGTTAVLSAIAAIHTYRNVRRARGDLEDAYHEIGRVLIEQFGESDFATGLVGSLALDTGELSWLNAGHPLPLLARDGVVVGELQCAPSLPMGLGGSVREVQHHILQRGDRLLLYTDGVVERRGGEDVVFGGDRLGDLLLRATLDAMSTAETVRRLTRSVVNFGDTELRDDATMVLLDYHGRH